jgi:hypothetical protein
LNTGFDSPLIGHFSPADFLVVIDGCEHLHVHIIGIEVNPLAVQRVGENMNGMSTDPIILRYIDLFDLESAPWKSSMHFGLQVESAALREIVRQLCQRLQPLATNAKIRGLDFRILLVKEKFGMLRIAYRGGTEEIDAEIERAKDEVLRRPGMEECTQKEGEQLEA